MNVNQITQRAIGAAIEVHQVLGPGLLEEAYQKALERELQLQQIPFESQKQLAITYKGVTLPQSYRIDLLVENLLVIEIKFVETLLPIHEAQLLIYSEVGAISSWASDKFQCPRSDPRNQTPCSWTQTLIKKPCVLCVLCVSAVEIHTIISSFKEQPWKQKSKPFHGTSHGYAISNVHTAISPPDLWIPTSFRADIIEIQS